MKNVKNLYLVVSTRFADADAAGTRAAHQPRPSEISEKIWSTKAKSFLTLHLLYKAILAIFQNQLGWLCPVSAALKNPLQEFKNLFFLGADYSL